MECSFKGNIFLLIIFGLISASLGNNLEDWDDLIDSLVSYSKDTSGTAHADRACIIGLNDGAPWTSAHDPCGLELQGQEGVNIAKCFKNKNFTAFVTEGIYIEGKKYQLLGLIDGKTVLGKRKGNGTITLQSSKTAIAIAHCPEDKQRANCIRAVRFIIKYLEAMDM